ncbi:unnamed protein product [Penicillium camemberti]|uniref:Str. FM013 n=1 Tax=Penicillium camemberti (strain FM 013) TaxID=1429867 RepID=A0A0G4PGC3_PENC3|nr:unnamed protein product [Penicillium camemberti]
MPAGSFAEVKISISIGRYGPSITKIQQLGTQRQENESMDRGPTCACQNHGRKQVKIMSGATLQRLVSAKKPRSDLALAPFSIFVTVCRCRVVVRAVKVFSRTIIIIPMVG